ncbi:MAG: ribonuclease R [Clostridia bacterium]|nr:ribonuclease R [Clostridia bacterium]
MNAKDALIQQFHSGALDGKTLAEIINVLQIPYKEKRRLQNMLDVLITEGEIFYSSDGKYGRAETLGLIQGTLTGNERGFAFLTPKDQERFVADLFVPHRNLNGALHGDEVLAERSSEKDSDEATVVKILRRGYTKLVGTFYKDRNAGYLCPDDKNYFETVYIPLALCRHIKSGVKAVAEITEFPYKKSPGGKIVEVLGDETDFFAEELSIIRSFNLDEKFPDGLEKEAERVASRGIKPADLVGRSDFRDQLTVTIDGEDTRDIDDAVSVEKEGNYYRLSVHIADVSHYVKYRSPLDKEAFDRGTSVYFPDRVLPMLPKALSNGICSLNPNEDRLALSCIMKIDEKGKVKESEIVQSVIRSKHKMTYTEITEILDGNKKTQEQYADVLDEIFLFKELTDILKTARDKKGGVELDVKEAKILYENGEITVPDYKRPFSYEIIEQFMVTANETVATFMQSIEAPFLYRIHEKPNEEKAKNFSAFAESLGLSPKFNLQDVRPYDYSTLLKSAENLPSYSVLNRVMLRSMQKARYSPINVGHFGLASDCYCHFTSPIRRYPDLCIHRIIKEILNGGYEQACKTYGEFVSEAAIQSSEKERNAESAEREVDALYIASYMSERIGEEYDAVVSGVNANGVFAELKTAIEGFIPIESLGDEFEYIPERFLLKGFKRNFTIGDCIKVKVVDVDFYQRRTIFSCLGTEN